MFEDFQPEGFEPQPAADRYRDIPLGVEAAWPAPVSDETDLKPGGNPRTA